MTNKQFEQIESLSKKLWEDINNGHEYSMVTYSEFLGIVTEVWEELQEEPVSNDLGEYLNELSKQFPEVSFAKLSRIGVRVAKWQKEQLMTKAIDGEILEMEDNDYAMCSHTHLELYIEPDTLEKNGFKDKDRVKVIVIKED